VAIGIPRYARDFTVILAAILAWGAVCAAPADDSGTTLERLISRQMAGKSGAVVALDVSSGKILAQSNLRLAVERVTAPGSAVKPFVLLELLQSGKIDPEQHLVCRRTLTIDGRRMDCTHSPAVTNLDAADAIAYSCNTYFAQVATKLSPSDLAEALERAGLTSRTGLVPDEAVGRVSVGADEAHLQLQALGYWGVEVTPLELLAAYRNLALHRLKNDLPAAAPVFLGLEHAVQYGMAHEAEPTGITAAGKTGTASGATPQTHGFFLGYAPADKPEIVMVVYLEHGRGSDAAAVAAPIFTAYGKSRKPTGAPR
jgi:cell division protein FtsI/penicillin-binding protein 2